MSDLRKAAELVIEAHNNCYGDIAHDAAIDQLRQALAQPEWVGLTNKERMDIFKSNEDLGFDNLYYAIECALREKNHG